MNIRFWLKVVISLVLSIACLVLPFVPQSTIPFTVMASGSQNGSQLSVIPTDLGMPLPDALKPGDIIRFDQMTRTDRLPFVLNLGNPPIGAPLDMIISRDGKLLSVSLKFVPLPATPAARATTYVGIALVWLLTALGLLLVWRGRHRATTGVAIWCLVVAADSITTSLPVAPELLSLWLNTIANFMEQGGTLVGLLLVSEGLARSDANNRWWKLHRPVFVVLLSTYLVLLIAIKVRLYLSGVIWPGMQPFTILIHLATFALPIAMILFSYSRVTEANRARIRWVFASILGIVASYLMGVLPAFVPISGQTANILGVLFTGIALCGFTYAVLRHQLVSIRFVVNRALAYGIVTSMVVGVFTVLTMLVERNTLGEGTNRLLELLVPLLLGITLHSVKKYVDDYINRWFFRRRYRAESALNHFARTCAYVDQPANLLKLTADELFRNSNAQSVGVYLIDPGTAAARCIEIRGATLPARIDTDDLALVRLRAGDAEINLHDVVSAFGGEGYAFPMAVRNKLIGIVICGPRPAEQYPADERKLFAHVASQVAVALHTLELQEQQKVLHDIAAGALQSLPEVRTRAQALLAPHLPV